MKYLKKLLFSLLIGSTISTIECEGTLAEIKELYPNRFAAGLNLSHFDLKIAMDNVKVHGSDSFNGICLGYEYRKPESLYVLFDTGVSVSDHNFHVHENDLNSNQSLGLDFVYSSILLGYTKAYCNWLWTPYLGIGGFSICNENTKHSKIRQHSSVFTIGAKCDYSFNDHFDLGANIQFFSNCGTKEYRIERLSHRKDLVERSYTESCGMRVSIPVTYHYGETLQWDIKIEPYYKVIDFKHNLRTYGANFLVGYNF